MTEKIKPILRPKGTIRTCQQRAVFSLLKNIDWDRHDSFFTAEWPTPIAREPGGAFYDMVPILYVDVLPNTTLNPPNVNWETYQRLLASGDWLRPADLARKYKATQNLLCKLRNDWLPNCWEDGSEKSNTYPRLVVRPLLLHVACPEAYGKIPGNPSRHGAALYPAEAARQFFHLRKILFSRPLPGARSTGK